MVNFLHALKLMEEGNKVRISTWGNNDYFWYVPTWDELTFDNLWCIEQSSGGEACMIVSWILSEDWVCCNHLKSEKEKEAGE